MIWCRKGAHEFQSTLPSRGATWEEDVPLIRTTFQSTLPSRGATVRLLIYDEFIPISIHAPLAGSDPRNLFPLLRRRYFNPRSPRGERRRCPSLSGHVWLFQSTLPSRGATRFYLQTALVHKFQSTLPSRGATWRSLAYMGIIGFQSTLPSRGATGRVCRPACPLEISIHAPLAGSDYEYIESAFDAGISIHAPLAGSDWFEASKSENKEFQSTLPSRGATAMDPWWLRTLAISIHAPLAGSDCCGRRGHQHGQDFNPRSPRGERLLLPPSLPLVGYFNPRSPRGERP